MTAILDLPAAAEQDHDGGATPERPARSLDWVRLPGAWALRGACRTADPEAFYAHGDEVVFARGVCVSCPVIDRCLEWALETGEPHGVWGGLDEDERRALRRPGNIAQQARSEALSKACVAAAAAEAAAHRRALIESLLPARPEPRLRTVPGLLRDAERAAAHVKAATGTAGPSVSPEEQRRIVRVSPRCALTAGRRGRRKPLTSREIDVLAGIANGDPRETIAAGLGISKATVKTHLGHIMLSLGARSCAHAVALGYAYGYLKPEPDLYPELPDRRLEVLRHLPQGLENREVAKAMYLSEFTVKTHLRLLMSGFGVSTRAALVGTAFRCGLLVAVLDESEAAA